MPDSTTPGSAATVRHEWSFHTSDERNMKGDRVRVATCSCGWKHMTAYRLGRRKQADRYLTRRVIDHIFPEAKGA